MTEFERCISVVNFSVYICDWIWESTQKMDLGKHTKNGFGKAHKKLSSILLHKTIATLNALCLYCPMLTDLLFGENFANPVMSQLREWCLWRAPLGSQLGTSGNLLCGYTRWP